MLQHVNPSHLTHPCYSPDTEVRNQSKSSKVRIGLDLEGSLRTRDIRGGLSLRLASSIQENECIFIKILSTERGKKKTIYRLHSPGFVRSSSSANHAKYGSSLRFPSNRGRSDSPRSRRYRWSTRPDRHAADYLVHVSQELTAPKV